MGDALRAQDNFKAAIKSYDRAIELTPDSNPQRWVLYYARGIAEERSGNGEASERDFRAALIKIWDSGRGAYGIANDAILAGEVGKVQTAGIAAARIRFNSYDDLIAFPATTNLVGDGMLGVLQSAYAGRAGMLVTGRPPAIDTDYPYTWAYVLIGSFISPYATRIRAKLAEDLDESDTTASIKDLIPYDGVMPVAWKASAYRGTVQNQMQFKGSASFYCDVAYNIQQDLWQLTGVQC